MNYILTITDPAAESLLTKICVELGMPVSIVFRGRGTAIKSMLDLLGIESHERRVFIAIADGEKSKRYIYFFISIGFYAVRIRNRGYS